MSTAHKWRLWGLLIPIGVWGIVALFMLLLALLSPPGEEGVGLPNYTGMGRTFAGLGAIFAFGLAALSGLAYWLAGRSNRFLQLGSRLLAVGLGGFVFYLLFAWQFTSFLCAAIILVIVGGCYLIGGFAGAVSLPSAS
jgi:hypothetical protein